MRGRPESDGGQLEIYSVVNRESMRIHGVTNQDSGE